MSNRLTQLACMLLLACAATLPALAQRGPGGGGGDHDGGGMGRGGPGGMMNGGGRNDFGRMNGNGDFGRGNLGAGAAPVRGPQLGPAGRWWDDKRFAKAITLRPDQQRRMDEIFESNKGQLLNLYANWQREESRLTSMTPAELQDESKIFANIDRVTQARADLEKENAHILLQIRHELDGDQLAKLDKETASLR